MNRYDCKFKNITLARFFLGGGVEAGERGGGVKLCGDTTNFKILVPYQELLPDGRQPSLLNHFQLSF